MIKSHNKSVNPDAFFARCTRHKCAGYGWRYKAYMIKRFTLLLLFLITPSFLFAECENVVTGYETRDIMYVLCGELSISSSGEATRLIKTILGQYEGPPDEIMVYFVKSESSIGVENPSQEDLLGYYYTHTNELVIWPGNKPKTMVFKIEWN